MFEPSQDESATFGDGSIKVSVGGKFTGAQGQLAPPFLQRSVSAPAIAENVSEAIIPSFKFEQQQEDLQQVYGYGNTANPSRLNPRIPGMKKTDQGEDSGFNSFFEDGGQKGGRPLSLLNDGDLSIMTSLMNDNRTPLDLIQADFPSTPSSLYPHNRLSIADIGDLGGNSGPGQLPPLMVGVGGVSHSAHQPGSDDIDQATKSFQSLYVADSPGAVSSGPVSVGNGVGVGSPSMLFFNQNAQVGDAAGAGYADPFKRNQGPSVQQGVSQQAQVVQQVSQQSQAGMLPQANGSQVYAQQQQYLMPQQAQPMYVQAPVYLNQNGQPVFYRPANGANGQFPQEQNQYMYANMSTDGTMQLMGADPNSMIQQNVGMAPFMNVNMGYPAQQQMTSMGAMGVNGVAQYLSPEQAMQMYAQQQQQQQRLSNGTGAEEPVRIMFNSNVSFGNMNNAAQASPGMAPRGMNSVPVAAQGMQFMPNGMMMQPMQQAGMMGMARGGMPMMDMQGNYVITPDEASMMGMGGMGMGMHRGGPGMGGIAMGGMGGMGGYDDQRDRRGDYRDNHRGQDRDGRGRDRDGMGKRGANGMSGAVSAVRDQVVEEFRSTFGKSGRQWSLRDLTSHIVAFCQDQHGSRFIQQRLEVCPDAEKQLVFDEILPCAQTLMTDVFGNYVLQKLFEYGNKAQCESLAVLLKGQAVQLSMQMYGCRVVQKALEYVSRERLVDLVSEFEAPQMLIRCVHDSNGNHVIQKCIEVVSKCAREAETPEMGEYLSGRIQFIISEFMGKVKDLSSHPYGCRVVQRILEHCTNSQKVVILEELRECCGELVQDSYGNYVIQFVMQHGWDADRAVLIKEVQANLLDYSQHKFASNVVEKCLQYANKKDRDEMIWTIINVTFDLNSPVDSKGHCVLESMVRDPYANYVVQKVIDVSDERQRGAIMRYVKDNITQLRKYTYGKHIIVRLEKITNEKF